MHMADALLSPVVGITMNALSITAIGVTAAKIKKAELSEKTVPLMGVAGAMVFAGQMINFAIPATGSSGHIGGGMMLAGLLGGGPAFLSIAAVVIIQCLFFADGGLLALGSNIFVIGAIPCLLMYPLVFKPLLKSGVSYRRLTIASIVAGVAGIELGALGVVILTLVSGITALPFGTFALLMFPIHFVIGIFEGIITAAVLCFIYKMRPEIIEAALMGGKADAAQWSKHADTGRQSEVVDAVRRGSRLGGVSINKVIIALAIITTITGGILSLFVSQNPDGLEWSISRTANGFSGAENINAAILPDYKIPSDPENVAGAPVSGVVGSVITFMIAGAAGFVITKMKKNKKAKDNG